MPLCASLLLIVGCAAPIQVERSDPRAVQREITSDVISTGDLSEATQITLRRQDLLSLFTSDPEAAIATLHRTATAGEVDPDAISALAELSFRHAEDTGKQAYYLAAAVYAFAFLFPDGPAHRPNGFDPRLRTAADLYDRGLTSGFANADRSRVILRSGRFDLPFGSIDVTFDEATARWGDLALSEFTPADELHIKGLQNRYRQRGMGAPLAASATAAAQEKGFEVTKDVKIPVTALLRINVSRGTLARGRLSGNLDVYPAFEPSSVRIGGQTVPLEVDTTAAFAFGLSDPKIWESEFAGFLRGDYFAKDHSPIEGLEPYRRGQIPVLFVHGTGSSTGRWADTINDLQSDPIIREHFQFWWYSYSTSNPVPLSALRLRIAIEDAVHKIDPEGKDLALRQGVLIGHSQGGLLAKMLVINSGSRIWDAMSSKPLDELCATDQTRELLRRAFFVRPVPEVRRVIFIATPHHGSFVAGSAIGRFLASLVTGEAGVVTTLGETIGGNPDAIRFPAGSTDFGSVWWMTPGNPVLQAVAAIPIAPTVAVNSIVAVQGNGPVETGNDGVVTYRSAHLDKADSELVVRSDHSVQGNPHTVAEVRRILLLHWAEFCAHGGCATAPATVRPTLVSDRDARGRQRSALAADGAGAPGR